METKICSNPNCDHNGKPQPLNNFYKHSGRKDGFREQCKSCIKKYNSKNHFKNKDVNNQKSKEYYHSHIEEEKIKRKKYREENKDKIKEANKNYIINNKEKKSKTDKKYRESYALVKIWVDKISKYEKCRFDPNNPELLQVLCIYCNTWFNPTNTQMKHRYDAINKINCGEARLYCSNGCKRACPIYNQKKYLKNKSPDMTSREVQPELRKLVLERDNWTCTKCNMNKQDNPDIELHCHHVLPINESPVESADKDNCITVCKQCHKSIHQTVSGCSYGELKCSN